MGSGGLRGLSPAGLGLFVSGFGGSSGEAGAWAAEAASGLEVEPNLGGGAGKSVS
jgi:hypothetical protein